MKSKMLILASVLAIASLACSGAAAPSKEALTTPEQAKKQAESFVSEAAKMGKLLLDNDEGESKIACACVPKIGPDSGGGPGPRHYSKQEIADIRRALAAAEKMVAADEAGTKIEFVAPAAAAPSR